MDHRAVLGQRHADNDFVLPMGGEAAILAHQKGEEIDEVLGQKLAGVCSKTRRQIGEAGDLHAVMLDNLVGFAQLAIAAIASRDVDDHRPRTHALHHRLGDQARGGPGSVRW